MSNCCPSLEYQLLATTGNGILALVKSASIRKISVFLQVCEVKITASMFLLGSHRALKVVWFKVLSCWYLPVDPGRQKVKWEWLCSLTMIRVDFLSHKTAFQKADDCAKWTAQTLDFSPTVPGSAVTHTNSKVLTSHNGSVATEEFYRIVLRLEPSVRSCLLALWWTSVLNSSLELICKVFSIMHRKETRWTLGYLQELDCIVQRCFWWLHF